MVSIIIPTYERAHLLEKVIPSYLVQKHVKQIIVIDDASKNSSYIDVINTCRKFCKDSNIEFVYIKNEIHKGVAFCRNIGLKNASEKYILWGEDDLYLQNDYIDVLFTLLDENKAACGTIIYDVPIDATEEKIQSLIDQQQNIQKEIFDYNLLEGYYRLRYDSVKEVPFAHAILLIPKSAYNNISYYEGYKVNGYREESDAQVQMVKNGMKILYCSNTKCYHLKREDDDKGGQHSYSFWIYELYKIRNNNIFIDRHYSFFKEKYNVRNKTTLKLLFAKNVMREVLITFLGGIYRRIFKEGRNNG